MGGLVASRASQRAPLPPNNTLRISESRGSRYKRWYALESYSDKAVKLSQLVDFSCLLKLPVVESEMQARTHVNVENI